MKVIEDVKGVICSPNQFFSKEAKAENVGRGIKVLLLTMLLSLIYELPQISTESNGEILAFTGLSYFIALPLVLVLAFIGLGIWAGINHLSAKLLGCNGSYKSLVACVLFSQAISIIYIPFVFLEMFLTPQGFVLGVWLLGIIILLGLCWNIYLYILIIKKVYCVSTKKAVCIILAPVAIVVATAIFLVVLFEGFLS